MGQIKLLEDHIADKIAAGEVIERPLSVVKELLENSLDAGADFIEIEIKEGGTRLIRVKDNGSGMDEADLKLAFQRHATSKIREFQDLFRLNTFGFRGEALPSVAAVSQVEMISCTAEEAVGHKIRIDGGTVQEFSEMATVPGTVIEVKNLFYNIPARRKFLKSSSYEAGLIGDVISKYAIGHPQVRFRYTSNGQVQLDTAGLTTTPQRMAYVYGSNLEPLIVAVEKNEIRPGCWVEAWLVREEITRNNRGQEIFFVNGRLVKSTELSQTIEESYYTLIAKGRFPVAVLQLHLPGNDLDVNVHPAKTEIKINGYEVLKPKLIELLKDALWEANITKNAFLPETVAPAAHQKQTVPLSQLIQQSPTVSTAQADVVAEPEKLLQWSKDRTGAASKTTERPATVTQDALFTTQSNAVEPTLAASEPDHSNERAGASKEATSMSKDSVPSKESVSSTEPVHSKESVPSKEPIRSKESVPSKEPIPSKESIQLKGIENLSVIGQLNKSFILAQNEEGLYIIDQHTCHERILYEKFMKAEDQKQMVSQPLLIPVTVTVSAQQDSVLMQHIFTLRELGFVLENFGERCYLLRSLPLGLNDLPNVEEFFLDLLHDLSQQKEVTAAVIKEKLLITASCKGAVKAHWSLTDIEMRTLLHDLAQVENAHTCPHGRPIIYQITMRELYKIFKRGSYHG